MPVWQKQVSQGSLLKDAEDLFHKLQRTRLETEYIDCYNSSKYYVTYINVDLINYYLWSKKVDTIYYKESMKHYIIPTI